MQDEYSIIGRIMAKYPMLTDEEQQVLNEWIEVHGREQFESIVDNDTRVADLTRFLQLRQRKEANRERYYGALVALIPTAKKLWWQKWPAYVAAASVVIITSIFMYVLTSRKSVVNETPPIAQVRDADPGKFKAKLRLADNTEIILDSALNKQLAEQGGVAVVNKDGKLVYVGRQNSKEVLYNTLYTGKGEMYATVLADGSKVWVNCQSSVRYPVTMSGGEQHIEITGEAYFDIVHNPKRKLTVTVNGIAIEDIGTQFNVNAYKDEDNTRTTVIEGWVSVKKGSQQVKLKAGQQARVGQSGGKEEINLVKDADLRQATAWKDGLFLFSDDNLKAVMRQLGRWYDVQVVYTGMLPDDTYTGNFPRDLKLSEILTILKKSDINARIEGKKLIVSP